MTEQEIKERIAEVSQVVAAGYRSNISECRDEAGNEMNKQCAIAASNTGFFILQSLGMSQDEIRALSDRFRT